MGFLIGSEQSWQLSWWMSVCVTRVSQWSGSRKICNCGQEDFTSLRMEGTDCRPRLVAQDNDSLQDFLGLFFLLTAQAAFPLVCVAYSLCFMVNTLSIHTVLGWHNWSPWQTANGVSLLGAPSKHSDVQPCELPPRADSGFRVLVIPGVYSSLGLVVAGKVGMGVSRFGF